MSKRFSLLLAIAATLLIASTLSASGIGTTIATKDQSAAVASETITSAGITSDVAPLVLPIRFDPQTMANSCIEDCRDQYSSCLDDCDKAPFPGCYNFCRFDVLYPCYGSCFG